MLPENRAHMSPECQLKELLEKLDIVSSFRTSGARTRRLKLLRKEINLLRQRLASRSKDLNDACSGKLPSYNLKDNPTFHREKNITLTCSTSQILISWMLCKVFKKTKGSKASHSQELEINCHSKFSHLDS